MDKFSYSLRSAILSEITPSKRGLVRPFIKKEFGYDADRITNESSLDGLLVWLLERADKTQRQNFLDWFAIYTIKVCDQCGKFMTDGYVVDDYLHFCSDECLHQHYSPAEYDALYDADLAYWTDWRNYSATPNWALI